MGRKKVDLAMIDLKTSEAYCEIFGGDAPREEAIVPTERITLDERSEE